MNTILKCHIVCQFGGYVQSCTECKCDIGGQCGATAADKTVKIPVLVTQTEKSSKSHQIQLNSWRQFPGHPSHQNFGWESG